MWGFDMIRRFVVCAVALAAVGFMVSSAEAGGSGSKKTATIKVKNKSAAATATVLAVPVASGGAVPTTQAQFTSLGGKQIAPQGGIASFPVAAGTGNLYAIYVTDIVNPINPNLAGSAPYTGTAGKTGYMTITGAELIAPTVAGGGGPF